jgi:pimeloyl-ACP methyl ester carboxylesterase
MRLNHHRAGAGEPLLLIHGIGSRWQMWEPVIGALAERHDVIAIDLPGFGASPMAPPGTPPGADSLTTLVSQFLAEIGVQRPHVAGNSLGGLIALNLAVRGEVRTATAVSPAGFANRPEMAGGKASLWVSVRAARLLAGQADRILAPALGRRVALNLFVAHPERMTAADAAASVRALAAAPWFDATLPSLRAMEFAGGERITVPVTIAWGNKDRLLLPRQARRAGWAIPRSRLISLRGCGHVPTTDDPAQVGRVLLEAAAIAS